MKLSAVVNTRNEAGNIIRCLKSVAPFVDEVVVVDMESTDETRELARKYTKSIYKHPYTGYVEPARNFAIEKSRGEWIFIIDADETIPETLALKLRKLIEGTYTFYRIPRKNIIFGKWIEHSGWWPDYQIRLFKKGMVSWSDEIHSIPITEGQGTDLPVNESEALTHYHYTSIEQYLLRLNRYTTVEAQQLIKDGTRFEWKQLTSKPVGEFLTRFFMWEGYKDGLHGLSLSLLQAISVFVVQLKLWEHQKFAAVSDAHFLDTCLQDYKKIHSDVEYWFFTAKNQEEEGITRMMNKIRAKIRL